MTDERVRKSFGFCPPGIMTDTEKAAGVIFDPNKCHSDLQSYDGIFVEIFVEGLGHPGIYRGTTANGTHVVMPATFPNGAQYFDSTKRQNERFVWRNWPTFYTGRIGGFRPLDEANLRAYASGFDDIKESGKYLLD